MLSFQSDKVLAVGEAMIEMAVVGDNQYRRGFAGDTYNTAWHMAQLLGDAADIAFATCIGQDTLSDEFMAELQKDGLGSDAVRRIADRSMGLYLIDLDGVERRFHYWRSISAAKCLADDPDWLATAMKDAGLIHVSGITLAILSPESRARLHDALSSARKRGARVSFDPNVRPKLWNSTDEVRATIAEFLSVTDIALPSFGDEQLIWGDAKPAKTVERFHAAGVPEVIVKNGEEETLGQGFCVQTPVVSDVCDTTGAGDAFNAGYLAGRLHGMTPQGAVGWGQAISGEVIRHFGARIPVRRFPKLTPS